MVLSLCCQTMERIFICCTSGILIPRETPGLSHYYACLFLYFWVLFWPEPLWGLHLGDVACFTSSRACGSPPWPAFLLTALSVLFGPQALVRLVLYQPQMVKLAAGGSARASGPFKLGLRRTDIFCYSQTTLLAVSELFSKSHWQNISDTLSK